MVERGEQEVKRPFKWLLCWNGKRQLVADL